LRKVTGNVGRWLSAAGTLILIFMMLYVVASVFRRAIFGQPILGDVEITSILLPVAAALFYIYTNIHGRHVRSTLVYQHLNPRLQISLDSLFSFVASGMYGIVSWRMFVYGIESVKSGAITDILRLPTAPFVFSCAIIMAAFALYMLTECVMQATEIRSPKPRAARVSH